MRTVLIGLLLIASIIIIATTLMMEPKSQGAGAMYGQDTNAFGMSTHRTKDKMLQKVTVIAGVVFVVCLIAIIAI